MKSILLKYFITSCVLGLFVFFVGVDLASARSVTTLCHEPGTAGQQTILAYNGDLNIHLAHGDTYGECVPLTPTINTAPTITRLGDRKIILKIGDTFTDPGATAFDAEDGVITDNIIIGGDIVDTSKRGKYIITYNVMDADGLSAKEVKRKVRVKKK